jgi:hypothetical protein
MEIEIVTNENIDETFELFVDYYNEGDPISVHRKAPREETNQLWSSVKHCLVSGLSQIMRDKDTNEIACIRFGVDAYDVMEIEPSWYDGSIEANYYLQVQSNIKPKPSKRGEWVYFFGLVTTKNYKNKGLAYQITLNNIERIKNLGYIGIYCFSSSFFSHKVFIKCGFKEMNFISYKDYEYNGTKPFENIESPHVGLYFMIKDLQQQQQ